MKCYAGVFCGFLDCFVTRWHGSWFSVMNFGDDSIVLQCQRVGRACKSEGLLRTHDFLSSQCPVHLPGRFCITSSGDLCGHCLTMRHVVPALGSRAAGIHSSFLGAQCLPLYPQQQCMSVLYDRASAVLGPGADLSLLPARKYYCQAVVLSSEALLKGRIGCGWLEGQGSGFKSRSLLF